MYFLGWGSVNFYRNRIRFAPRFLLSSLLKYLSSLIPSGIDANSLVLISSIATGSILSKGTFICLSNIINNFKNGIIDLAYLLLLLVYERAILVAAYDFKIAGVKSEPNLLSINSRIVVNLFITPALFSSA